MKKDYASAGISQLIEATIGAFLLSALLFILIGYGNHTTTYSKSQNIARKYLSQMEISGYLTDEMKTSLIADYEDLGFNSISLEGSVLTKVENGNQIVLKINAQYNRDKFFLQFFNLTKTKQNTSLVIVKSSISKCYQ